MTTDFYSTVATLLPIFFVAYGIVARGVLEILRGRSDRYARLVRLSPAAGLVMAGIIEGLAIAIIPGYMRPTRHLRDATAFVVWFNLAYFIMTLIGVMFGRVRNTSSE